MKNGLLYKIINVTLHPTSIFMELSAKLININIMRKKYFNEIDETKEEGFSFISDFEGKDDPDVADEVKDKGVPILPLRNMVLFPGVILPISIGRKSSVKLIEYADKNSSYIGIFCQKDEEVDEPELNDIYPVGSIGKVLRILDMPDDSKTVIVQGYQKCSLLSIDETEPYKVGKIAAIKEDSYNGKSKELEALVESCKDAGKRFLKLGEDSHADALFAMQNIQNKRFLINFLCSNFPFKVEEKEMLLKYNSFSSRGYKLLELINRYTQLAEIKASIQMRAREDIDQQQKEYFLQQQIKTIQDELGNGTDQETNDLRKKAAGKKWPEEIKNVFDKEVTKLERLHPQSPDYSVQLNYLETMINLPWGEYTKDNINLKNAEKTLDKDHYGLEKVKERILEHLAVMKLKNGDTKSPIICLYGPPGVGKTSLGRSIATALKRKYVRMSLGGVHDEAEIRGHRRTYIGAMPGQIIKSLQKAGTSNPVFILDEVDKLANDRQGDPSSALLEVLDPEQNNKFHDNFLDVDYDLSKVMFIATANNLNTIPQPLLDRMELIEMSGYITEEKIEIARRHLIPKELDNNGLSKNDIKFPKSTIEYIIENYSRESGVRELEKKIGKIMRKLAKEMATNDVIEDSEIKQDSVQKYLGIPEYIRDKYQGNDYAGVVTGLAWTSVGGEILFVETSLSRGKGEKFTLTGNLGDVMKESAMLALEYIKAHTAILDINPEIFNQWNIHVHVPEGAIPKDGPSAGITMVTSIASALTNRKVKKNLAMTGEITLRGKVLPVGGIKEKILAAKRAGITEIILCEENRRNIEEIQPLYLKGVTFHYVADVKDVLKQALTEEPGMDNRDYVTHFHDTDKKASDKK